MSNSDLRIAEFPKAELHLHLEGSLQPKTVCHLAATKGLTLSLAEVLQKYSYTNSLQFLEAFKWVTTFLTEPRDFALATTDLAQHLLTEKVVYAEITLSVGIMLLRKQDPQANFAAILAAAAPFESQGLRLRWVFDAVRQFGAEAAMRVVDAARLCNSPHIVAFGIGGDELSVPTHQFRSVYDSAANSGLHLLMHAGEAGGPEKIREAIELLGAERIGHGIAAIKDPALMDLLAERRIPLEICPTSNVKTGALAALLGRPNVTVLDSPLPQLLRHGIPVVLSTDDPAMFHTNLFHEYENVAAMGLSPAEMQQLADASFTHSFAATNPA